MRRPARLKRMPATVPRPNRPKDLKQGTLVLESHAETRRRREPGPKILAALITPYFAFGALERPVLDWRVILEWLLPFPRMPLEVARWVWFLLAAATAPARLAKMASLASFLELMV